ncbi:hypothetical protein ACQ686_005053 [Klebsiella aerogenes]|uniref:hypothetical protein n=1 Tax=Klebsiella aerogenes TaxID=548 RepID=UPI000E2E55CF|nr:hypothetical protein [Klebsiella aerogenes]RSW73874.1 hypothetical protein EGH62_24260 [Klebsiella aerogenes]
MTDIARLLASLKRRSAHAKEFGDSVTFVKLKDIDALVEALEKAQTENTASAAGMAESYETTISMLRSRIAELEESHAQVIQSRDHYKRMSEEGLKQLVESRTVIVKLPEPFKLAKSSSGLTYYYADEVNELLTAQGIKWEAE